MTRSRECHDHDHFQCGSADLPTIIRMIRAIWRMEGLRDPLSPSVGANTAIIIIR